MFCPSCGVATQLGQRFCNGCGAAVDVAAPQGGQLPPPSLPQPDADTIAIPAGLIPPVGSAEFDEMFRTADFAVVEQTTPTMEQVGAAWDAGATGDWNDPTDTVPQLTEQYTALVDAPPAPFRLAMLVLAVITAAATVTAAALTVARYRVTGDIDHSLVLRLNDIATNALVATLLSAGLLIVGAALGLSGRRFGSGLAGGAGLAAAAFFSGRHQRGGVCLHLGLVFVAAGQLGRAGHGRLHLHGARRGHCVERLGRHWHGRGELDGGRRLAGVWRAGFCTECAGMALFARWH
jgi:hypothetical protein